MPVNAKLNYLRISPRKVRLVADLIRGKSVKEAQTVLNFTVNKSALPLLKVLNQAIDSAKINFELDSENLFISKIIVNEGPKYKRWNPRARGQAYEIQKKTSHVILVLDQKESKSFSAATRKEAKIKKKAKPSSSAKEEKIEKKQEKDKFKEDYSSESRQKDERSFKKAERPKPLRKEKIKPPTEKGFKRIFKRKAF